MKNKPKISKEEIKNIYKDTRDNHSDLLLYYFYRPITFLISSRFLLYTPVTPNQLTMTGFVLAIIAAVLTATGKFPYLIFAAVLIQLVMIFDLLDGEIARLKKAGSNFGAWLDGTTDFIKMVVLYFALGIGYYRQSGKVEAFFLLSLLIASRFLLNSTAVEVERTYKKHFNESINFPIIYKICVFFKIKPKFLTFSEDFKYLILSLGTLFNQLKLTMLLFVSIHLLLLGITIVKTVRSWYLNLEK